MSNHSYFSRLLRKNIWIYFFSFLIAPTGYIVKMFTSHSISIEELGILYGVMSFFFIIWSYNDFGMTESLNYFLPHHIHHKDAKKITNTFSIAIVTQLISSTILAIILYFSASFLAAHYFHEPIAGKIIHILTIQFFSENIFRTLNTFFQAVQDAKAQKMTDFLRMVLLVLWACFLWYFKIDTIYTYAWNWVVYVIFWVWISLAYLVIRYHEYFTMEGWFFDKASYMHVLKYAVWAMLSANVGMLLSQIDMQMVTYILGSRDAGYFTAYLSLIRIPFIFLLPWVFFLFPVFSDLLKRDETEKVSTILTFFYELFSILALMMTSFFLIFGDSLTSFLFWSGFDTSARILLYSTPFLIFNFLLQIDFQILSATGRPRNKMFILLAAVFLNMTTNYIFIHLWWVVGSAFAAGLWWVFIWSMSFQYTRPYLSWFRWSMFLRNAVGVWLLSYLLVTINIMQYFHGRIWLFVGTLCAICFYGLLFVALNWWEFRRFKRIFFSRSLW